VNKQSLSLLSVGTAKWYNTYEGNIESIYRKRQRQREKESTSHREKISMRVFIIAPLGNT
jgi:hypothetical protein